MRKFTLTVALSFIVSLGYQTILFAQGMAPCSPAGSSSVTALTDSLLQNRDWPAGLEMSAFSGPDLTPSPAALGVAPTGEVYVGVDMQGSLGKSMGLGSVVRLVDCNYDGIVDSHTTFATMDNPRGILPIGDQVFVLYTTFSEEDSLASGQDLVVYQDENGDGVADGPPQLLIEGIGNPNYLRSRGTDHATNGIQMGIDGWIYIAVGDFGFHNAVDREGTELTMLGGGIVRVRPDGTEMEVYTHGTRNIYDVAIDPYMNIFTRGNTNDGGGWNVRFIDHIQSGEYGYPVLFKNYTEEILPALIDVGGGSGTGALYMDDDRWPEAYNHVPMMADWGRDYVIFHRVAPYKGSFFEQEEYFMEISQITDLDVDASGVLYLSAWDGAGFRGDMETGYTVRAVPEGLDPSGFPNLENASVQQLGEYLQSTSAKARSYAQYELLQRPQRAAARVAWNIADNEDLSLDIRVAGLFTYAQIEDENAVDNLVDLTDDAAMREFALRALTDRMPYLDEVPTEPFLSALNDPSDRVRIAAIVGLGRLGRSEAVPALLDIPVPYSFQAPEWGTEGPHAVPNSSTIPAHVAVQALVRIGATGQLLDAVESEQNELALWALRYVHQPQVPQRLISVYENSNDEEFRNKILNNLARIYHREAPYDASWWWSTRPDTHGPYYDYVEWGSTPLIRDFLLNEWRTSSAAERDLFTLLNTKYRLGISEFGVIAVEEPAEEEEQFNFGQNNEDEIGQVGESSIEDIIIAVNELEGNNELGQQLFVQQGCQACHSINAGEAMRGPFLGQIGGIMDPEDIAMAILRPNDSISQGFSSVQIQTGDNSYVGFVTQESANTLMLRDITGQAYTINKSDITLRRELESSIMPTGLADALDLEEFTALVKYLSSQTN